MIPSFHAGRLTRLAFSALLSLSLLLPAGGASADIITDSATCVEGWAKAYDDPELIEKALDFLANNGQCIGYFGDTEFEVAVGVLAAANVAKENCQNSPAFAQAQQLLNGVAGGSLGDEMNCACAVATSGVADLEHILQDVADAAKACGGLVGDFEKIGKEIVQALGQALKDIDTAGSDTIQAVETCLEAAGGQASLVDCLSDIGGAAEAWAKGVEDLAKGAYCDTLGQIFGGCDDDGSTPMTPQQAYWFCKKVLPGIQDNPMFGPLFQAICQQYNYGDLECNGLACAVGTQCGGTQHDTCVACSDVKHGQPLESGTCGCSSSYTPHYTPTASGPVLTSCSCDKPYQEAFPEGAGQQVCLCPAHEKLKNGACVPCDANEIYDWPTYSCKTCAALGTKPNKTQDACVPTCNNDAGEILGAGGCVQCKGNSIAVYQSGSLGQCQDCGSGRKATPNHLFCVPACEAGQVTVHGFVNPATGAKSADSVLYLRKRYIRRPS